MTSHTHRIDIGGEVVTKTYIDWARGEYLREWTGLQVISAARPHLVPVPIRLVPASSLGSQPSITMSREQFGKIANGVRRVQQDDRRLSSRQAGDV
ncbi:MAG: hypothetical protein QOH84_4020 [Kribbellaceae bacterium]|nr:hypothetical protein [Kribbellaceae bacterium]